MLTQNITGRVGPVTFRMCWSYKVLIGPTIFLNINNKKKHCIKFTDNVYLYLFYLHLFQKTFGGILEGNLVFECLLAL